MESSNASNEAGRRRLGVGVATAAVAAFLAARLTAWPPHEDELLALYVARGSLGQLADTVFGERGGAPLHFLLAWIEAHAGGGLTGLRVLSAIFAVASIPVVAALARRLGGPPVIAAALVASSWTLLFHAVYGRMYSLFLLTSALSFLALLRAQEKGGRWRWTLWGLAALATIATHPYGALVLAAQALYVLVTRARVREALVAFAAVAVLATPFWATYLVLAERFEVGVGPGGTQPLGRPDRVAAYLWDTAADFSAGPIVLPAVLVLAVLGWWRLWQARRGSAWLVLAVVAVPTLALLVARLGASAGPATRHLIFVLPFFATAVAVGVARRYPVALTVVLVAGGIAWAWDKTPSLFTGEPSERVEARAAAAAWLAATGRPDDVFLGYEPLFLQAADRPQIVPRADAGLALDELEQAELGRGVWAFSVWGPTSAEQRLTVAARLPRPSAPFEARTFGPYLVLRSREQTRTVERYLELTAAAMIVGKAIGSADGDVNFATASRAAALYASDSSARSASTSSR